MKIIATTLCVLMGACAVNLQTPYGMVVSDKDGNVSVGVVIPVK